MSQEDVINLLTKSKEPLSVKEITKKLKLGQSTVSKNINRLLKEIPSPIKFTYRPKHFRRPTRVYFIR